MKDSIGRCMENEVLGCLLKRLRERAGIDQARAARSTLLSQAKLSRIERGSLSATLDIRDLDRLLDLYGLDLIQGVTLYTKALSEAWAIVRGAKGKDLEDDAERWQGSVPEIAALAVAGLLPRE